MRGTLVFLYSLLALSVFCQDAQRILTDMTIADDVEVSLLTCGTGTEVYTMYGHSALRVQSKSVGVDLTFNYGTFDSFADNFILKFVRGRLPYRLSVSDYSQFLRSYQRAGRSVIENTIELDSTHTAQLIDLLRINYLPENRTYAYDFFYDNCSTRLWDIIDQATGGELQPGPLVTNYTYRDLISIYQQYYPWLDFGIQLIIGSRADRPADVREQTFIPDFLQRHIKNASLQASSFVAANHEVLPDQVAAQQRSWFTPTLVFSLLLALEIFLVFIRQQGGILRWYDRIWWLVILIAGLIFTTFWIATDHAATHANYNLLWANPLVLFLFVKRQNIKKWVAIILLILSLISILGVFGWLPQVLPQELSLVLSISILKLARIIKPTAPITQAIGPSPTMAIST